MELDDPKKILSMDLRNGTGRSQELRTKLRRPQEKIKYGIKKSNWTTLKKI
jgi:hypothetical protein